LANKINCLEIFSEKGVFGGEAIAPNAFEVDM
jgi:hypothetical protein